MREFWRLARHMLYYRKLLILAACGLLIDTIFAGIGMGGLLVVIEQFLSEERVAYDVLVEKLSAWPINQVITDPAAFLDTIRFPHSAFGGFATMMIVLLTIVLLGASGRFLHIYIAMTVSLKTVANIRRKVFQRLVHMPMAITGDVKTGDALSRIMGDCGNLKGGFNTITSKTLRSLVQAFLFMGMSFYIEWRMTLAFIFVLLFIGIVVRQIGRIVRRATRENLIASADMTSMLQQVLIWIRVVKVYEGEGVERRRFNRINREVVAAEMKARTARSLSSPLIESIAMVGIVVSGCVAAYLIYNLAPANAAVAEAALEQVQQAVAADASLTAEQGAAMIAAAKDTYDQALAEQIDLKTSLIGVIFSLGIVGGTIKPLSELNNSMQVSAAAAVRITEILGLDVEPTVHHGSRPEGQRLPRHHQSITFENITFSYPRAQHPSLYDINLTVNQGEICAIVGTNGSGKTTLLSLLARLYEPEVGRVLIDGRDIADCRLRSVRRQMAVVTQDTVLFDGTIAENLLYGQSHRSREQMIDAACRARADEFVDDLPDGYDTHIGELGSRLSGGQRQRLAIARAILRDPAILILDEATSQIDADSEAKITAAVNEFARDRTTFVIAHRLSTVVEADSIVVMDAGRIIARGTHKELLETCELYQTLCRTQLQTLDG